MADDGCRKSSIFRETELVGFCELLRIRMEHKPESASLSKAGIHGRLSTTKSVVTGQASGMPR